jgi:hypothetical protein
VQRLNGLNFFQFGKTKKLVNVRYLTKYRGIKICARDVAEPFAEPAGSIRSRALDGRVARLVSRSRVLATNMGQSRTCLVSLKSDQDAEDTISVADLQHALVCSTPGSLADHPHCQGRLGKGAF